MQLHWAPRHLGPRAMVFRKGVHFFRLLTCLLLCNTQAVNLIHAMLCDNEGVTLDVSLCNTQARAVNLIHAVLCDDEGGTQARGC